MIEEMMGSYGNRLFLAAAGVGVGLVLLVGILWLMRKRGTSSPFIRGGKNRQPRLQVLDAAAIDTRRRLVLVRRDNVEHLVMIGGPTDIVIESGITANTTNETAPRPLPEPEIPALTADVPVALPASRRPVALAPPIPTPVQETTPQPVAEPQTRQAAASQPPAQAPRIAAAQRPDPRPRTDSPPPAQTIAAPVVNPPANQPAPPVQALQNENDIQKEARSEFERILEAEMTSRAPAPQARPAEPRPDLQQRREPVAPPAPAPSVIAARQVSAPPPAVSETVPDAEVQKEIARIFGEMSVTRDK